jgi:hypothetical protein
MPYISSGSNRERRQLETEDFSAMKMKAEISSETSTDFTKEYIAFISKDRKSYTLLAGKGISFGK